MWCFVVPALFFFMSGVRSIFVPNITYISFLRNITSGGFVTPEAVYMANVSKVDDNPKQFLLLPWEFPYFGTNVETFWVSPNGGLLKQASGNSPDCNSDFYGPPGSGVCDVDNSFYGMLSAFYTDLYPDLYSGSSITYTASNVSLEVLYSHVPYYGPPVLNPARVTDGNDTSTFGIELFQTGQISLNFYDLFLSGLADNDFPVYMAGMREFQDTSQVVYTSQQVTAASNWGTTVLGVYPPTVSSVQSGLALNICPISVIWALSPSVVNVHDEENISIALHPLSATCFVESDAADMVSYGLCIRASNSTAYSDAFLSDGYFTAAELNCVAIVDICSYFDGAGDPVTRSTDAGDVYVNCTVSPLQILASLGMSAVPLPGSGTPALLEVVWKHSGQDHFETLPVPPVPIEFIFLNSSGASGGSNCSVNLDPTSSYDSACELFAGNVSSLELDCFVDAAGDIYDEPSCSGACLPFDLDYQGICCDVYSEMDCSGLCFGRAFLAPNSTFDNLPYCCSNIDFCGVCNGTDFNGTSCSAGFEIETGFPDGNIYSYYDIAPFASNSGNHLDIAAINLTNSNVNATLYVSIGLGSINSDPFVDVTESTGNQTSLISSGALSFQQSAEILIPPGDTITLLVKSNINQLIDDVVAEYNGAELFPTWEVQGVVFEYGVVGSAASSHTRLVSVFPASFNCSAAPSGAQSATLACSRLPGCIFCRNFDHMRILRGVEVDDDRESAPKPAGEEWMARSSDYLPIWQRLQSRLPHYGLEAAALGDEQSSRNLYIPIMPAMRSEYVDHELGVCNDGWLTRDCDYSAFASGAARVSLHSLSSASAMACVFITIVCIVL